MKKCLFRGALRLGDPLIKLLELRFVSSSSETSRSSGTIQTSQSSISSHPVFPDVPWMAIHKMPIKAEVLLNSVVLLQFEGYIRCGLFGCISQKPISENHVFGIMSKALGHQPEKGILDNFMLSEFQKILPKMIFHSFCAPEQSQDFIHDFDILHQ